jgi:hypothetical protein
MLIGDAHMNAYYEQQHLFCYHLLLAIKVLNSSHHVYEREMSSDTMNPSPF